MRPSRSRYSTVPASGGIRADRQLSSVVLPDPDSPTTPNTSPGHNANDTSRQAARAPKFLPSSVTLSSGGSVSTGVRSVSESMLTDPIPQSPPRRRPGPMFQPHE